MGVPHIEATPEMIEAGSNRLAELGAGFGYAYVAEEVWGAMERARTQSHPSLPYSEQSNSQRVT